MSGESLNEFLIMQDDDKLFEEMRRQKIHECCDLSMKVSIVVTLVAYFSHIILKREGSAFIRASYVFSLVISSLTVKLLITKYPKMEQYGPFLILVSCIIAVTE